MFNDLEDIIDSLDNKIKRSYNGDNIILKYQYDTIYLRPSYLYQNLIFLYTIFFNTKSIHLFHINDLRQAILYYLSYPNIGINSTESLKYRLIKVEDFIELISYNDIYNTLLIDSNEYEDDIIILEKSNCLFKLPFSNIYINTYFYYEFFYTNWDLIPLISYLKKKRKEYTCQIFIKNEFNNYILLKDNDMYYDKIKIRVKINELAFKETAKSLDNGGLLSFLDVNQFRIK